MGILEVNRSGRYLDSAGGMARGYGVVTFWIPIHGAGLCGGRGAEANSQAFILSSYRDEGGED